MLWVALFGAIALVGLAMLIGFAVWLWRKAAALGEEVVTALERVDDALDLLGQIGTPKVLDAAQDHDNLRTARAGTID